MASQIIDPTTQRPVGRPSFEQLRCSVHLDFALEQSGHVVCRLTGHGVLGPAQVMTIEETPAKAAAMAVMQYIHKAEGDLT